MASSAFVDPSSPEGQLQLLLRKHANLAESVQQKNTQISALNNRVAHLERDKHQAVTASQCYNRVLETWCQDITLLIDQHVPSSSNDQDEEEEEEEEDEEMDAFAQWLHRAATRGGEEEAEEEEEERGERDKSKPSAAARAQLALEQGIEREVASRSARALKAIAKLSSHLEQAKQSAAPGAAPAAGAPPSSPRSSLSAAVARMHSQLRATQAALRRSRDETLRFEARIRQLQSEVDASVDEKQVLERKIFKLRVKKEEGLDLNSLLPAGHGGATTAAPAAVAAAATASGGAATTTTTPATPASTAASDAAIAALKKTLDERATQVKELETKLANLESELTTAQKIAHDAQDAVHRAEEDRRALALRAQDELHATRNEAAAALRRAETASSSARTESRTLSTLQSELDRLLAALQGVCSDTALMTRLRVTPPEWADLDRQLMEQSTFLQQRFAAESVLGDTLREMGNEAARRQEQVERLQVKSDALSAAVQEAAAMREAAGGFALAAARAEARVNKAEVAREVAEAREALARARVRDMEAFWDAARSQRGDGVESVAEETMRAVHGRLEEKMAEITKQLDQVTHRLATASTSSTTSLAHFPPPTLDPSDAAALQIASLQHTLAETRHLLDTTARESEVFARELDAISSEYDKAQAKNAALVSKMQDQEQSLLTTMQSRLQLERQVARALEERDKMKVCFDELMRKIETLEQREKDKGTLEATLLQREAALETVIAKEKASVLAAARQDKETLVRERNDLKRQLDRASAELGEERAKRQRLREEKDQVVRRVERLLDGQVEPQGGGGGGGGGGDDASKEIRSLRNQLNCSVCHVNRKSAIITKCCHMFCSECIEKNLQTRHRKCPGCNLAFSQGDVKQIYFS